MLDWIIANGDQILGFATGAACVFLAGRSNVWNYPIGIANNLVFLAVFFSAGLYASAGLQLVYLVLGAHGWWRWTRRIEQDRAYAVHTPRRAIVWLVAAFVVIGAVLVWVLTTFTDSHVAFADAGTTAASLVAQYMLNRKWIENWFVWIAVDVAFTVLSAVSGLWIVAALYVLFIGLCLLGLRSWRRLLVPAAPLEVAA
ncbi:nicotinamide riboside transporter PnuC [Microbacterium sp. KR10-403]|uniref:nicotinamide riboside transporter PnuC n=1 Tax=Microbacterium sp. KR10-403 TaxID=3158581 RepID=UPI0032E4A080